MLIWGLAIVCAQTSLRAQTVVNLGVSYGQPIDRIGGLNDLGQVTGTAPNNTVYIYSNGTLTYLQSPPGGFIAEGYGINNSGQVVGDVIDSTRGNNFIAFVSSGGTMTTLGTLPGDYTSEAFGINSSGQVVGESITSSNHGSAFLYSNGTMIDLGTLPGNSYSTAYAINNSGEVVGNASAAGNLVTHAFLYKNGTMTDLGVLAGFSYSSAVSINASGQIVGNTSGYGTGVYSAEAFLYSNGTMSGLGTLGGTLSFALSINDQSQIVGYSTTSSGKQDAFLYSSSTGMEDLNTLYASLLVSGTGTQTGFTSFDMAADINASGQIVGLGTYWNGSSSVSEAFLLTQSVPEPSTWALLFLSGLGLFALQRSALSKR